MANPSVIAKFVSKKISKTRIQPVSANVIGKAERFVTGSWDDGNSEIVLWEFPEDASEPSFLDRADLKGDCNDLLFVDPIALVTATSSGSVILHKVQGNRLHETHTWKDLHTKKGSSSPCTGIACWGTSLATIGENGSIHVLFLQHPDPQITISDADSCTLTSLCFVTQTELLTGNSRGLLKLWDLRKTSNKPVRTIALAEDDDEGATSFAQHPTQGHIIAVGGAEGTVFVYDLRQPEIPVSIFGGPSGSINELMFHPTKPELLFSCSEDGSVWQWKSAFTWLDDKVDINEVLPQLPLAVNSIDISGERIVLGADNEAVYYIPAHAF